MSQNLAVGLICFFIFLTIAIILVLVGVYTPVIDWIGSILLWVEGWVIEWVSGWDWGKVGAIVVSLGVITVLNAGDLKRGLNTLTTKEIESRNLSEFEVGVFQLLCNISTSVFALLIYVMFRI